MIIKNFLTALSGLIFSLGLILGGMLDPSNVLAFLNVSKHWNPSLMFVLGGAVCVTFCAVRLQKHLPHPFFDHAFHLPSVQQIDKPLVIGSCLFGFGWGLVGFCPGPAIASIFTGQWQIWVFLLGLLIGIKAFSSWKDLSAKLSTPNKAQ